MAFEALILATDGPDDAEDGIGSGSIDGQRVH